MWQKSIFQTLTLLLLACNSLSTNPYCPICGWGKMVTDPGGEVFVPTYGSFSCELLETRSQEGFVPQGNCLALQMFSRRKCGCEPAPPPTPSPVAPTQPPTIAPTQPLSTIARIQLPTTAPTQPPTTAPSLSAPPSTQHSAEPSNEPTAAPSLSRPPSAEPSTSTDPTSSPSEVLRHEIVEGLTIQLIGISELPGRSIQEWISISESFISNFFSITNPAVQDLDTTIIVTGVVGVPEERRSLRKSREPSFVIVSYTQEFMYRTTDDAIVDAAYLATMPFAEKIGRKSCSILLQDSGVDGLADVKGVSAVQLP